MPFVLLVGVTFRVSNVNGSSGSDDVDCGFLIADANASRTVDRPELIAVKSQRGQAGNRCELPRRHHP